jgi:hypothetical protein
MIDGGAHGGFLIEVKKNNPDRVITLSGTGYIFHFSGLIEKKP